MPKIETVLVLGAYGLVGREIVEALLTKTELTVIASGRNAAKLEALAKRLPHARLSTRRLDAYDARELTAACGDADLVINAVGPYTVGGADIARSVLESGRHYVDFSNEQSHYKRLEPLDSLARDKGLLLLAGAGVIPGVSTLMVMRGAERLPDATDVDLFYAQGRMPDEESGLGGFLGGVLELSALDRGLQARVESLPEPFGEVKTYCVPTLEALTVPKRSSVRSLENWWMIGEIPPGMETLLRLLKPHKREWAYRLFVPLTRWAMRGEFRRAVKKGLTTEAIIKVVVRSTRDRWEGTLRVEDGGVATAYLPVLAAKQLAEGRLTRTGLVTPVDVFELDATFRELEELGWKLSLQESSA